MRQARLLVLCALLGCASPLAAENFVKVDNNLVRIEEAVETPHHQGARHHHELNRVMIYLDGGNMTLTYDDGHKDEQHWKPGDVAWSPAGDYHRSENVGPNVMHIVEVAVKTPAPARHLAGRPEMDPVATDAKHNILLFENDQVRVFRSWREAGASETMHEHIGLGRAAVFLTDVDASIKLADGTTSELHGKAGDVHWSDGTVTHATTNLGKERFEVIVVEVK
ncbi:MAG TPA: cupin domain-containing protein [Candidatus Acidoferrum sp.]|nr:cupin domain-containing protein [Candidatus Acidoferrum sp.]